MVRPVHFGMDCRHLDRISKDEYEIQYEYQYIGLNPCDWLGQAKIFHIPPNEVICWADSVFWIIALLHNEVPPNYFGCISLQIGTQNGFLDFWIHSSAIVMSCVLEHKQIFSSSTFWHLVNLGSFIPYIFGPEPLWLSVLCFENSKLAFWILLLNSILVWPLHLCSQSVLWTVDRDTFTPALWRLRVMSLTVVFESFFTALTVFVITD